MWWLLGFIVVIMVLVICSVANDYQRSLDDYGIQSNLMDHDDSK